MTLGQKIKRHRLNRGLTQEQFGAKFNATKGNVATWEKGVSKPRIDRLKIIADEMKVSVTDLLENSDS